MPTVRQLKRYTIPRYPRGTYHLHRPSPIVQLAKTSTAAGLILGLFQGCPGVGVTGPPPVLPDMMSEAEARQIINRVFEENGIELTPDVPLVFHFEDLEIDWTVVMDGYSAEKRVGFEYYSEDEPENSLTYSALQDTIQHGRFFEQWWIDEEADEFLEVEAQAFIDSLKAMGWI